MKKFRNILWGIVLIALGLIIGGNALGLTNNKNSKNLIKGLNLEILGDKIKAIRKRNNLSQENIAEILNVTQSCIIKYKKNKIFISTENVYKLAKEFKISMNELCGKTKK